ncbi:thermonuclease family protein [Zoogloea sp.]|uniref:thermonuclease family protein n=1 Tax=Zoogloea sp. TaxID=49181 RepID=UPI00261A443D|nr:thermonuclease family protein [Zoogloea sp.]MDD3352941.1 thermonuclease family protein [Zoogloea sp.]
MKPFFLLIMTVFLLSAEDADAKARPRTLAGQVVAVADGDTLTLLDRRYSQYKIRLLGIDAPERAQAFGRVSREHLARRTMGKEVTARCLKRDRYQRWLCRIELDGVDVNQAQVAAGLAWHYRAYGRDQTLVDWTVYALDELRARQARRGLWSDPRPVAPWDYRRSKRVSAAG